MKQSLWNKANSDPDFDLKTGWKCPIKALKATAEEFISAKVIEVEGEASNGTTGLSWLPEAHAKKLDGPAHDIIQQHQARLSAFLSLEMRRVISELDRLGSDQSTQLKTQTPRPRVASLRA